MFAAMLFISMAFMPAVMAADGCVGCAPNCGECHSNQHTIEHVNTDCTRCHEDMDPLHGLNVVTIELEGSEKSKAISTALKNEDVKLVRKALIKDGYQPDVKHATAAESIVDDGNGQTSEVLTVTIPFRGGDAAIVYSAADGESLSFGVVHYVEDGKDYYTLYTVSDGVVLKETYDLDIWACVRCAVCAYYCGSCSWKCAAAIIAIAGGPSTWWAAVATIIYCAYCGYFKCYQCYPICRTCIASV